MQHAAQQRARAHARCMIPSNRKVTETSVTSLVPQMLVRPGCLRTSCTVNRTLINLMSAGDQELASFVALPCSEKCCVFDTPRFQALAATQMHSQRPSPVANTASLVFLMAVLHFRVHLAVAEEAWASARIDKRAFRPCVPGLLFF